MKITFYKHKIALFFFGIGIFSLIVVAVWTIVEPYRDIDSIIENGTVLDGSGGPSIYCDVAIRDGKVVGLGGWRFFFSKPKLRINAKNKIVAPGFIDVHTHVEMNIPKSGSFYPANFLLQGVTTLITGNCGKSSTDIAGFFDKLKKNGTYINIATLIGHNSVRNEVMGTASRLSSPDELFRMEQLVNKAMNCGALGLSTGLIYVPGRFADLNEVVSLTKIAEKFNGLYVAHIRDEGRNGIAAIQEALEIGRLSGAHVHISHFKCSGPLQWHTAFRRLQLLDDARKSGQDVTIDAYPYDRSSTTTDVLLPDWAVKDNRSALRMASQNSTTMDKLHHDILVKLKQDGWKDLTHILIASGRSEWIGRTLAESPAAASDLDHQIKNLISISLKGGAQVIYADMDEKDVDAVIEYPFCVFGSDSAVRDPGNKYKPHPRGCGTFPRIFRHYVRDLKSLQLNQAVNKASGKASEIFGLENRGIIREGNWADIVIFDPEKIEDKADYSNPFAAPSGIDYVIVNGGVVVDHGQLTHNRPGGMVVRKAIRTESEHSSAS